MTIFMENSMEEKKVIDKEIPYIVFESTICRFDRVIKRLWIIILILIFLLLGSNLAWLYYESQFEEVTTTTTQEVEQRTDGDGDNSFIGGDIIGDVPESENNNDKNKEKAQNK